MQRQKNTRIVLIILLVLLAIGIGTAIGIRAYNYYKVDQTYYTMAGNVTIVEKGTCLESSKDTFGYDCYIVVEEFFGYNKTYSMRFTLYCSQEVYDRAEAGEMVWCIREQSLSTKIGVVTHDLEDAKDQSR